MLLINDDDGYDYYMMGKRDNCEAYVTISTA